jgi:transposase-like protein
MSKIRRSFSASEKLSIINIADQFGVTVTLCKHNLSPRIFRRWKENFNEGVAKLKSYANLLNSEVVALEKLRKQKTGSNNEQFIHNTFTAPIVRDFTILHQLFNKLSASTSATLQHL